MIERSLTLGYPSATIINVTSPDRSALTWLREFLVPDFDEHSAAAATHQVTHPIGDGRVALLRAVRAIAEAGVISEGGVILHAAAVSVSGRAYAIAGPKEAGKTTLLLHLLQTPGAQYIANDRVVLRENASSPTIRGMPTIVRVRGSSLRWFEGLEARFRASGFHHRHTIDEAARDPDPPLDDGSFDLTPAQCAHLVGVARSGEVPLAGIICPRRTDAAGALVFEPLDVQSAVARLRDALLGGDESRLAELCARIPVCEGVLGLAAYHSPVRLSL